jgi:anaerobic selenocysteine-containing dehydrogenase
MSAAPAAEIKQTTCYMCACRCGIDVHLQHGKVARITGNRDHPKNHGVLCGKGAAGVMNHFSPARLRKPLKRVGPRGAGEFVEIEWDEALATATDWLGAIRRTDPRKLAFFTGRDQSQALTGWWAAQFGTPNFAAHGGFCSVNMAAAGLYSIGGSFWEFGEPDWDHTKYLMLFGVAEDHDSNPIKIGLAKLKQRGAKIVSINPVRTGYSAIADEWIGIRPGTDGVFVLSLIYELLHADRIDLDFLVRYANAHWLVIQDPGTAAHGMFARDAEGRPLCWDRENAAPALATAPGISPAIVGEVALPDGRRAVPVFQQLAERYMDAANAPDAAAAKCGVPAETIRRIARELADTAFEQAITLDIPWTDTDGRTHETTIGRPVAMHAMRGISAHSNGFDTCRAIHVLQMLLGAIDCPGAFRYKPPFPKPIPPGPKPAGKTVAPMTPLGGMPLGFPTGPEDLLLQPDGSPTRIDKAYSWEAPVAAHGLMHMVITNAYKGDPYPIDTLFMFMANMSWNSAMNTSATMEMLTDKDPETGDYRIPRIIYSDAFTSEMVAYADLVLPDTTYLERWDCMSLLDRPISDADGVADAIRQPVVQPDRDVRPFQDVLLDLGARLGLPGMTNADGAAKYPGGYGDYLPNHERTPGIGPLAGWRGEDGASIGRGAANPDQLDAYIRNGAFWRHELEPSQRYYRFANRDYLAWAATMGFVPNASQIVMQLYSEPLQKFRLAAEGHGPIQPPEHLRARLIAAFDPLPAWREPLEGTLVDLKEFPLHAITQRPMAMYHSWGGQNAWLRQIYGHNDLYVARVTAAAHGLADGDWAVVTSHIGRIRVRIRTMDGVQPDTVWTWNAIGKRAGSFGLAPDAPEARQGFLLNHLISELLPQDSFQRRFANADPVTGQAAWYDLRVRLEKCTAADTSDIAEPQFPALPRPAGVPASPDTNRFGAEFRPKGASGKVDA